MPLFGVTYTREQRKYFEFEAENQDDALERAQEMIDAILDGSEKEAWDESDDPGEFWIDEFTKENIPT
jgi:hypothetical protein